MELLAGIPGIEPIIAATVIAEIGIRMSQWPSAGHLASWAGPVPGAKRERRETG
jgi:transposase